MLKHWLDYIGLVGCCMQRHKLDQSLLLYDHRIRRAMQEKLRDLHVRQHLFGLGPIASFFLLSALRDDAPAVRSAGIMQKVTRRSCFSAKSCNEQTCSRIHGSSAFERSLQEDVATAIPLNDIQT